MKMLQTAALVLAVSSLVLVGCKKKSSTTTASTAATTTATPSGITGDTTSALPSSLAIAANTEPVAVGTANRLAVAAGTDKQDPKAKKKRLGKAKNPTAKADCFEALRGLGGPKKSPACYGPQLYYTKHANHTTPSGGASTIATCPQGQSATSTGCLPGGDLGIWSAAEADGTACAAAKINSVVQRAGQTVDLAVGATAAMLCIAKLNKTALPAMGKTLDLGATLKADADMKKRMTVTAATITRESNTAAGRPVYTSKMDISITPPGAASANTMSLTLRHVPLDDTNTTYKGLLTVVRANGNTAPPRPLKPPVTKNIAGPAFQLGAGDLTAVSVIYNQSATTMTYKVVSAEYAATATAANIFNATTGEVDVSKTDNAGVTGWKGNMNLMIGTSDTAGDGSLAIAWQAGSNDGYTRNFNASTSSSTAGVRTGTAYFGFAENLANAAPKLAIDGMICNWAGPGNQRKVSPGWTSVQKQTMTLSATTGIWGATASNITFAPTNSCDWTNVTDSTYSTSAISAAATKGVVTNNLVPKSSGYSFTVPTAPALP